MFRKTSQHNSELTVRAAQQSYKYLAHISSNAMLRATKSRRPSALLAALLPYPLLCYERPQSRSQQVVGRVNIRAQLNNISIHSQHSQHCASRNNAQLTDRFAIPPYTYNIIYLFCTMYRQLAQQQLHKFGNNAMCCRAGHAKQWAHRATTTTTSISPISHALTRCKLRLILRWITNIISANTRALRLSITMSIISLYAAALAANTDGCSTVFVRQMMIIESDLIYAYSSVCNYHFTSPHIRFWSKRTRAAWWREPNRCNFVLDIIHKNSIQRTARVSASVRISCIQERNAVQSSGRKRLPHQNNDDDDCPREQRKPASQQANASRRYAADSA